MFPLSYMHLVDRVHKSNYMIEQDGSQPKTERKESFSVVDLKRQCPLVLPLYA